MGLIRLVGPAVEPITVLEAAAHMRLDSLNVELPPDAPTVALAGAGPGNVDNGAHRYRLTFVTADGETDGGDISAQITVADKTVNGQVSLSTVKTGGALVTARRIWRSKAGTDTPFYLVGALNDNLTTVFVDNVSDAALGIGIPTRNTTSDPLIKDMIIDAREYIESHTNRALITQKWRLMEDSFPPRYIQTSSPMLELASGLRHPEMMDVHKDVFRLPKPPCISVDAINYIDSNGTLTLLDPATYVVSLSDVRAEIARAPNATWPSTQWRSEAVQIDFTCGYGPTASVLPGLVRRAMRLLVAHFYSNREIFLDSRFALEIPHSIDDILWKLRAEEAT